MKYTIEEIINQRIGLKPMTEEQFIKLYKVLKDRYPQKIDNSFYFRSDVYYRLFPDFIDRFGSNSNSYMLRGGNWDCTKEINFEQINFEDMDFLIERGSRTPDNDADWKDFIDWLNETYNCNFGGNSNQYYGLFKSKPESFEKNWNNFPQNIPIITLEDWKKRYKMEDKKIIGYKCPMDLYADSLGVGVEKGEIFDYKLGTEYRSKKCWKIAQEIVESWEPVYESLEEVINMGEFSITIKDGKASSGPEDITDALKRAVVHFEACNYVFGGYTVNIDLDSLKFTKTGCKNTTTTYNQWLEIYKKLK